VLTSWLVKNEAAVPKGFPKNMRAAWKAAQVEKRK
jgi:hypothetical protein